MLIKHSLTQISVERSRQVHSKVPSVKTKALGEVQPDIDECRCFSQSQKIKALSDLEIESVPVTNDCFHIFSRAFLILRENLLAVLERIVQ